MAKKRRPPRPAAPEAAPRSTAAIGTSLRERLAGIELSEPAPQDGSPKAPISRPGAADETRAPVRAAPASHDGRPSDRLRGDDRIAYFDALAGVRPLRGRSPPRAVATPPAPRYTSEDAAREMEARARLHALVAGGVRFEVRREADWIEGVRCGAPTAVLRALRRSVVGPDETLDLHGLRAGEAAARVVRFVREAHRTGVRRVRIVHGRGTHSADGRGVLADAVVEALTGGAAPFTLAFISAPGSVGGALLVELTRR